MADVINLRMARKTRARDAATQIAAQKRALHGQTRAARAAQQAEQDRASRDLAGKRRDTTDPQD